MLKAELLSYNRDGHRVFSGISFDLRAGTCLFVKGHNGSGKTTLLRLLAGFLPIQEGKIFINGIEITKNHDLVAQNVEYIGHLNGVKRQLTAWDNLKFWNSFSEPHDRFDLDRQFNDPMLINNIKHQPIALCSSGQIRRVALSRLHTSKKKLWLLDEPTSALDKQSIENFEKLVESHCLKGGAVVIATHMPLTIPNINSTSIKIKKGENKQTNTHPDPFLSGDW